MKCVRCRERFSDVGHKVENSRDYKCPHCGKKQGCGDIP